MDGTAFFGRSLVGAAVVWALACFPAHIEDLALGGYGQPLADWMPAIILFVTTLFLTSLITNTWFITRTHILAGAPAPLYASLPIIPPAPTIASACGCIPRW